MAVDFVCALTSSEYAPAILGLHSEARHDPELAAHLRDRYLAPRASTLYRLINRAINQGHLDGSLPTEVVRDALFGPAIYRYLLTGESIDDDTARTLVAIATAGLNLTSGAQSGHSAPLPTQRRRRR